MSSVYRASCFNDIPFSEHKCVVRFLMVVLFCVSFFTKTHLNTPAYISLFLGCFSGSSGNYLLYENHICLTSAPQERQQDSGMSLMTLYSVYYALLIPFGEL